MIPLLAPLLVHAELRTPVGAPRDVWVSAATLALYFLCAWISGARAARGERWLALGALLSGGLYAVCGSTPLREIGVALALAGLLRAANVRGSADALRLCLAALAAALVHWLLPIVLVRLAPSAGGAALVARLLAGVGADAVATERGLAFVREGTGVLELGTGVTQLCLREIPALYAAAGVLLWTAADRRDCWRGLSRFSLAVLLGFCVRQAVSVVVLLESRDGELVLDPWLRALTFAVPASLWLSSSFRSGALAPGELAEPLRVETGAARPRSSGVQKRTFVGYASFAGGAALLALSGSWSGPCEPRPGGIAIEVGHSSWERLDVPFDRNTYGALSSYNYQEWVRGLEQRWGAVERLSAPLDDAALRDISVLILKTPTTPYTLDEVAAIHRFVFRGGGVYLVGDHNDVFGMNTILNSVAAEWGIEFRPDALTEIEYVGGQVVEPAAYPPHALTRVLRPLHYMTSCSMRISKRARPVLWMNSGFADDPDYAKNNFIGDGRYVGSEPLAPLAQVATVAFGAGRVLAFTDSTLLSSFSVHFPGVRELAFDGVAWLRQRERLPWLMSALLGLGAASCAIGAWLLRARLDCVPAAAALGLAVGLWAADRACAAELASFDRQLDRAETVFDTTLCAGQLPIWHESHDHLADNFWGLFLGFQRGGAAMRVALEPAETFGGRQAILVWPKAPLPAATIEHAKRFVAAGGTLFVFEDRLARGSATNQLLEPFGLRVALSGAGRGLTLPGLGLDGSRHVRLRASAVVRGGEPVLLDDEGEPLAARTTYGAGTVVLVGIAEEFSNKSMATSAELRGVRGYVLMQIAYAVIDAAAAGGARALRVP
jgi:hypothetical protein